MGRHVLEADPYRRPVIACTSVGVVLVLATAVAYTRFCPCFHSPAAAFVQEMGSGRADGAIPSEALPTGGIVTKTDTLDGGVWRLRFFSADPPTQLTWANVIDLWRTDRSFQLQFSKALAAAPHPAFFWETPPLTHAQRDAILFECVAVPSRNLAGISADPEPFSRFIGPARGTGDAVAFDNLGGDAHLVAPCEDEAAVRRGGAPDALGMYAHIAVFVRSCTDDQAEAFWSAVGNAVDATLRTRGAAPTWVSTEGSGVSWLHVRLDIRPKYYHYQPYTRPPG